jgi:isocitrate dehydrogenase kinase/phosphatase
VTTTFRWVKEHNREEGNEKSDALTKEGVSRESMDLLDLEIPREFNLQRAKLATITQTIAYGGITERTPSPLNYILAETNFQITREAIENYSNTLDTDATIWKSIWKKTLRNVRICE